jgi:hypothetical protein
MSRFLFLMLISFLANQIFANQIKVLQVVSGPEVMFGENQKSKLTQSTILKDEARFKTAANQFIKMQLGGFYELSILDQSDVLIEQKGIEGHSESFVVQLLQGQVYLKKISHLDKNVLGQKAELNLKSVFFDWKFSSEQNLDLLMEINTKDPSISFCQREGEFQLALFDHEKKIDLKTLEGVRFQGQNESEKVAFDILLNGRKIPKGLWQQIHKCSFDEIQQKESEFIKMEQLEREIKQKKVLQIKQDKLKADSKYLCHVPYGQLNDCAWVLKAGRCQKTRCNAEGKWTGAELISIAEAPECKAKPFVSKCDN